MTSDGSPNDVRHLVIDVSGSDYRYLEGQSAGIVPPGVDTAGKPNKLRLYSIASPAVGDDGEGKTFSLCVKRVVYTDPETGKECLGVCSNHLCDLKPGDEVDVTGPTGKMFLLPDAPNANLVMIATGTGIAPFRGFLHNRYSKRAAETGQAWLFFGMQHGSDYLYKDELTAYQTNPGFNLVAAISREEQTADGRKMYVQDRIAEHRAALLDVLQDPNTYVYICGLRGMEKGILEALNAGAQERGQSWDDLYAQLQAQKRWHVEVY